MKANLQAPRGLLATVPWLTITITMLAVVAGGILVAKGYTITVLAGIIAPVTLVIGVLRWQWLIYGLLAYIPFLGIPSILLYPNTETAVLLKDFAFILPAYLGFVIHHVFARKAVAFREAPLALFIGLTAWVVTQVFNPGLPTILVGLIGAKVWLLYIPLYFLGYHLLESRESLLRLLSWMTYPALIPAVIGIVEAVLLYNGYDDLVYAAYGPAASAVTQDFARFDYESGGSLLRVPSTFSFVTQYYAYTSAMVGVVYAWWQAGQGNPIRGLCGAVIWSTIVIAGLVCGARGAFLFIPLLVLLLVCLTVRWRNPLPILVGAAIVLPTLPLLLSATLGELVSHAFSSGSEQLDQGFIEASQEALSMTWFGIGTGSDTGATRYAVSLAGGTLVQSGPGYESWLVKVIIELGLPGLVLVTALCAWILGAGLWNHFRLRDSSLGVVSAALLSILIWNLVYFLKGFYIDLDPMNVYFWLFAGMLARIPSLDHALEHSSSASVPDGTDDSVLMAV
jgi:hypothetical protein